MKSIRAGIFAIAALLAFNGMAERARHTAAYDAPQYRAIKGRLIRGWGTWDSSNVLEEVLLPAGFAINLGFKQTTWISNEYLDHALIGLGGPDDPHVRPGLRALDGSYSECELQWHDLDVRITAATIPAEGNDLVMLVEPVRAPRLPIKLLIKPGMLWNRPGSIAREANVLRARAGARSITIYTTAQPQADPYANATAPYLAVGLIGPIGISTASPRSIDAIRAVLADQKSRLLARARSYGNLSDTYLAMESVLAWNTIYEPQFDRVVTTVGRIWNRDYGGYCLFGWDNFFLSYLTALYSRDLAYANLIEHLRSVTYEGFIPNDDRGNHTKSWDHSQPPVGALMLKEIYKRYPEKWLLNASFPTLMEWNRWWFKARTNDGLLSYGSNLAKNPYDAPDTHTKTTAGYESGMDDSPMYEGVAFNGEKNTLELQDVGLNSLYIADCRALAEIAVLLGRTGEAAELTARAQQIEERMAALWSPSVDVYLNRRTDTGQLSTTLSPTMFYPLIARMASPDRAKQMVDRHLMNPDEFYGEYMIPSVSRVNPDFPRQRYWKGAVWPPLNFLVYFGLRNYGFTQISGELAQKSNAMLLQGWREHGIICENYSAITGKGDDPRLSSDPFHSWGALMGIMSMIESGAMPAPEDPLTAPFQPVSSKLQ